MTWTKRLSVCTIQGHERGVFRKSRLIIGRTHNHDPADRSLSQQLRVAEESSGRVVVDVQEGKRLLLEDEEDGVNQFPELRWEFL